ncbi:MAG: ribonuclease HI [Flavobacteriales bacterium]|nr:ribonuclease HI [Flavobacteriales bacterium]
MSDLPLIKLYSDGGAEPNPGKGGFGLILKHAHHYKEVSQGFLETTNNRMELLGVITGFEKLKHRSEVHVYTDSKYVVDAIEKGWAKRWRSNNWYPNSKKEKALNPDLWARLLDHIAEHRVKFFWVKGHNGHRENERCDVLATMAIRRKDLLVDEEYVNEKGTAKLF